MGRIRSRRVSPRRFVQLSAASLAALYVVVTSGAFVRLTASGLGCDNWPRCGDKPFPETGYHAFVEFGNRVVALVGIVLTLVAWIAATRVDRLPRWIRRVSALPFLGAFAQIPLGGLTVILDLHPLAVMGHFLLALVVVGLAAVQLLAAWSFHRGHGRPIGSRLWRHALVAGVVLCAALVVTGAVATASGPHSGGEDIRRLGISVVDAVYVHVRVSGAFGSASLLALGWLWRRRATLPGLWRMGLALVAVLVCQAVLGEIQYRNALPWGLVLVHVLLAATAWTLTVMLAYAAWRPPAPMLAHAAREAAHRGAGTQPA
jgi:cytochrome c oxidase assembly protein subunit 15